MAKIQRLKISTDEKMSMLRGQPGHMPAAPAAASPPEPVATAPEPAPAPVDEARAGGCSTGSRHTGRRSRTGGAPEPRPAAGSCRSASA